MADGLRVTRQVEIPFSELRWRFSRSSGPGGQSVNTSDTRVELSWNLLQSPSLDPYFRDRALERLAGRLVDGVVTVVVSEHRSQLKNREAAQQRLVELVAAAVAPPPPARRVTKPSKSAKRRRLDGKRHRGEIKRMRRSTDDS